MGEAAVVDIVITPDEEVTDDTDFALWSSYFKNTQRRTSSVPTLPCYPSPFEAPSVLTRCEFYNTPYTLQTSIDNINPATSNAKIDIPDIPYVSINGIKPVTKSREYREEKKEPIESYPPRDFVCLSIITCTFCCIFFGFKALNKSLEARKAVNNEQKDTALELTKKAKVLNIRALRIGKVIWAFGIGAFIFGGIILLLALYH